MRLTCILLSIHINNFDCLISRGLHSKGQKFLNKFGKNRAFINSTLYKMTSDSYLTTDIKPVVSGTLGTKDYEVGFVDAKGAPASPWHDLPMIVDGLYTMVVEIPRNTRAKMEILTSRAYNPIKQDLLTNGDLRDLDSTIYWNYGAIPKTWEAPLPYIHKYTREDGVEFTLELVGDNDPIDIVDVGRVTHQTGDVLLMKPVGALSLIDQDEIDWKIFAVSKGDEHFDDINDLEDIDKFYPGTTTGVCEFFRWYKAPKGKPLNKFLPYKTFIKRDETLKVLEATHRHYCNLIEGKVKSELWYKK